MYCGMELSCVIIEDAVTKVANITTNNTKGTYKVQTIIKTSENAACKDSQVSLNPQSYTH